MLRVPSELLTGCVPDALAIAESFAKQLPVFLAITRFLRWFHSGFFRLLAFWGLRGGLLGFIRIFLQLLAPPTVFTQL